MANISLVEYARFLGSNKVSGMAQKVRLVWPPPPPVSVRNLVDSAGRFILPLAPIDLQPQNGASNVSNNPDLFFRDPGAGTPASAFNFEFEVSQNNVEVGSPPLTGPGNTSSPLTPPGIKWFSPLPPGTLTLTVWGKNRAGSGPASSSTFTVSSPPPPPPPQKPNIKVVYHPPAASARFSITGTGFVANHVVHVRGVNLSTLQTAYADTTSDSSGAIDMEADIPCAQGTELSFSANDERPDPSDLTGTLWSNTVTVTAT
jgi:hypothetical protein